MPVALGLSIAAPERRLLVVAGLCLAFSPASRTKAGEPRCSPRHLHLKPVDVPMDVFEVPSTPRSRGNEPVWPACPKVSPAPTLDRGLALPEACLHAAASGRFGAGHGDVVVLATFGGAIQTGCVERV